VVDPRDGVVDPRDGVVDPRDEAAPANSSRDGAGARSWRVHHCCYEIQITRWPHSARWSHWRYQITAKSNESYEYHALGLISLID
jgi:hypothetical protein